MLRAELAQGLHGPHKITLWLEIGLVEVGISTRRRGKYDEEEALVVHS
jgi:hypothetical protein